MAAAADRPRLSLARLTPFLSVLFFALALWLLHGELKSFHYRDIVRHLESLPAARIWEALGLTLLGYLALTGYDTLAFHYMGKPLTYPRIALASFIGYAFSNSLGMPLLTGMPVRVRFYAGWGVTALDLTRVMLFSYATFWLGFFALSGTAFVIDPPPLPAALHAPLGPATLRPAGALFLGLVLAYLLTTALRRRPVAVRGIEVAMPGPGMALTQVALASIDWFLACAVLYSLLPPGTPVTFLQFLAVFLFAQIGGLLSHVPAGLGVFETLMVLLLPPEVSRPELLASMVAYRAVYYFLPLLVAAVSLGAHEALRRREQVERLARFVGRRAPDLVPQVFALSTFLGGTVLLVSGATPAVHSRLSWLQDVLPLPVVEISHFLGSLAGVGLLFLAMGLQRRLDAAYQLTVALLASGVVFSLAKGLDWEEACILAVMLASLVPCRRHFYRRTALTAEPFTPGWMAAIAVILLGAVWLGLFSYKHVDYSRDLWWHFTFFGNAPRFLRAAVGALGFALALSLARLMRPALPEPSGLPEEDLRRAAEIAARSPRSYAYLVLLRDKRILFNDGRTSFVMFGIEGRSWVALGDPVGPEREHPELVWRFREMCDRHAGWTCFYQVSERCLHLYVDLGLSLVKLGEEALVPLAGFSLEGSARKKLRHAHRKAVQEGCSLEVVPAGGVAPLLPELERISDGWLRSKNTREKGFSLGFFDPQYLNGLPVALVRDRQGRIVAFANLWPGGSREELSIDLMRHTEDAPGNVMDFLFLELMVYGAREGYRWFNLGMAPLSGLEARALAPMWSRVGALVFRHGEHFYNFQGLRQYKDKYDPVWVPRYLACPGGLALPRVLTDIAALISGGLRGIIAK